MKINKSNSKNIIYIVVGIFFITILCLLTMYNNPKTATNNRSISAGYNSSISYTRSGFLFDTYINIVLYPVKKDSNQITNGPETEDDYNHILSECFDLCSYYENLLSPYIENSDIYNINHSSDSIKVNTETLFLINEGLKYCKQTNGRFDITVGNAYSLWDFSSDSPSVPSDTQLKSALESIDYNNIVIENDNRIKLLNGSSLELGALAKGYIADSIKSFLIEKGITSGIINLGGNVLVIGQKPDNSPFRIGIKKPFTEDGEIITDVLVDDCSVVTAGIYERYFERDNKIYHHILDPKTGTGVYTDLYSATIICKSSLQADALSTICILYGKKDAIEMLSSLDDVSAILIDNNNKITRINL